MRKLATLSRHRIEKRGCADRIEARVEPHLRLPHDPADQRMDTIRPQHERPVELGRAPWVALFEQVGLQEERDLGPKTSVDRVVRWNSVEQRNSAIGDALEEHVVSP